LEWSSSDPSVVEIINDNIAVGRSEGTAVLTVTAEELTASFEVTVEASREALDITNFISMLAVDQTFSFSVNYISVDGENTTTEVSWESSNPEIATVSASGIVTGIAEGTTDIKATAGNVSDMVSVTVTTGPVMVDPEVRFTAFTNSLVVGQTFQFEASYFDEFGQSDENTTLEWSSSSNDLLTIDASGLATATGPGTVQVTVSGEGLNAMMEVILEAEGNSQRTGSLRGTGYDISGSFTLSEDDNGDLILSFEDAMIDRSAPGPYFYLTNQDRNVSGGVNLGKSQNGTFEINVTENFPDVELNTYANVMVWCEPFNVRLGIGSFDN